MDIPVVEDDMVKVKVLAAPVNPSDINSIQGMISNYDNCIMSLQGRTHCHHSYRQLVVTKWLA